MIGAVSPPFGLIDWRMSRVERSIAVRPEAWARACDSLVRAESTPEKKKREQAERRRSTTRTMPISSSMRVNPR